VKPTRATLLLVVNFLAFQAGWFACVLGAARGWPLLGPLVALLLLLPMAWYSRSPRGFLALLAIGAGVGFLWDSALSALGLFHFAGSDAAPLAPLWIVALWMLFASTCNRSLRWLQPSVPLAVGLAVVAAPLSYLAGQRLGALQLPRPALGLAAQALGWAVILPALLQVARRLDVRSVDG
jgi:hypothetical protein